MKFSEALKHYEQGKAIRLASWLPGTKLDPNTKHSSQKLLDVDTFNSDWELYEHPKVRVSELKEGELFDYMGNQYRKVPSYLAEYSEYGGNVYTIIAMRHKHSEFRTGELVGFSEDCLVKRVS